MDLYSFLLRHETIGKVVHAPRLKINHTNDDFNAMMIATDFYQQDKSIFVVCPNLFQAQKYYETLSHILPEEDVLFFPADELITAEMVAATGDFLFERIQTICTLFSGGKKLVIMNLHGAIKYELPKEIWEGSIFTLRPSMTIEPDDLIHHLLRMGYERVYTITKTGEFAKRGSIVDIFPLGFTSPIRLDFFADEIDSIRFFDMETQRSTTPVSSVTILPVTEILYDDVDFRLAKDRIGHFLDSFQLSSVEEEMIQKDLFSLEHHTNLSGLMKYLEFFNPDVKTIFDFVSDKRIYWIDPVKCKENYDRMVLDLEEYCGRIGGYSFSHMKLFSPLSSISASANIWFEGVRSLGKVDMEIPIHEIPLYYAKEKAIIEDLKRYKDNKYVILSYQSEERFRRLQEVCLEEGLFVVKVEREDQIRLGQINGIAGNLPAFHMIDEDFVLLNEAVLFENKPVVRKARFKSIYKNAVRISKYDELEIGDYVVHYDYGIGKYLGIKTLTSEGIKRDFLYVMYDKGSKVYIPLEQISSIMKFASKDVEGVTLHEIGSTAWARTKAKVRKKVHDISGQLISLYAARQNAQGFAFPPDSAEQALFENDFEYELTPDQKQAIDAVKADMESSRPMDRLICGDVGYGKTEVAMRGAFKAVYGGKQVAVLAPTTILSMQHYQTFQRRMEPYGIRVELLNRFVPQRKQKKILEDLRKGGVDIVIGTHRILSEEVVFKDLGLLIVDEEQRFGVTHKEKIKEMKVNVDCMTLSATPIPRTLQMSVIGLKDLSMIETPPKNRYPVQTYVLERNDRIIADAIERELSRGGQVFYLYHRVDTIDQMAAHLHTLVPEARICVGHGKLSKDQLENRIREFIDKKYDILLCTTIIETGIDMPDTNTLLIHQADSLGLSQLYQIRGRVGRSSRIAYAYLMYEPRKRLTPEAEKRLETIKEFNELGSGFKIAMRDLSIRGSGDLLGEEQSGFVESVGLDMYLKILNEEIHHIQESEESEDISLKVPLTDRTISPEYIENEDVRIEIHKKIDALKNLTDLDSLKSELTDRFGEVPNDLLSYMYEKLLKVYCKEADIVHLDTSSQQVWDFAFGEQASMKADGNFLFQSILPYPNMKLTYRQGQIHILVQIAKRNKADCIKETCLYFHRICEK